MEKDKNIERSLKWILKNGDLIETIDRKKNWFIPTKPALEMACLSISRIALVALWGASAMKKRFFLSTEKVWEVQNQIRKYLGINIDIARDLTYDSMSFKPIFRKELNVIYENSEVNYKEYKEALEKIFEFCQTYSIRHILLNQEDLNRCGITDLEFGEETNAKLILFKKEEFAKVIELLNPQEQSVPLDLSRFLTMKDFVIHRAIEKYLLDQNKRQFIHTVKERLEFILNSSGVSKDKIHEKVFETVFLQEEYVKVNKMDRMGNPISNEIMPLFEYLGFSSEEEFMQESSVQEELNDIARLYLFLKKEPKRTKKSENAKSYYDRVYQMYKETGIYENEFEENQHDLLFTRFELAFIFYLTIRLSVGIMSDKLENDNSFFYKIANQINQVYMPFEKLEGSLLEAAVDFILNYVETPEEKSEKRRNDGTTGDSFTSITGDVSGTDDYTVATIDPLQEDVDIPNYFTKAYATEATYMNGHMKYDLKKTWVDYVNQSQSEATFEIVRYLGKFEYDEEKQIIYWDDNCLLPSGKEEYAIASIYIKDEETETKIMVPESGKISKEEMNAVKEMQNPEIHYVYARKQYDFIIRWGRIRQEYLTMSEAKARALVCEELQLPPSATVEEIFAQIQSKKYSKTPIKDAGLTEEITKMNEEEFIRSVASMDSLVCNLAATLAVAVDEDLVYTTGYYVATGRKEIKSSNAHAWAYNEETRKLVDITPYKEKTIIDEIMAFCIEKNLGMYIFCLLVSWIVYQKLGKKVKFTWKIHEAQKILEDPKMKDAYAWLNEILYGGVNIAVQKSPKEWLDTVKNEYSSFSKSELKELKQELKSTREKIKSQKLAIKLVNNTPFILENEEVLTRKLTKSSLRKKMTDKSEITN